MSRPWVLPDLPLVFESLHETVDEIVTEPFLRNWIDTMCIFCGFPAKGAMTAHILYILDRFFEDGACYSVPIGGTEKIADTMVRGLKKFGGTLTMNPRRDGRAVGVRLKNGKVVKGRRRRPNATPFDTVKMLGEKQLDGSALPEGVDEWRTTLGKLPATAPSCTSSSDSTPRASISRTSRRDRPAPRSTTTFPSRHMTTPIFPRLPPLRTGPGAPDRPGLGRSLQDSQNLCSFSCRRSSTCRCAPRRT